MRPIIAAEPARVNKTLPSDPSRKDCEPAETMAAIRERLRREFDPSLMALTGFDKKTLESAWDELLSHKFDADTQKAFDDILENLAKGDSK